MVQKLKSSDYLNFPTFFRILKKYLSDGATIPVFFRELIEMITEDDSDNFIIDAGIAAEKADSTLISYSKRDISNKMARQIVYKINTQNMVDSIESRPTEFLDYLAHDFRTYFPDITSANVAKKVTEFFASYIRNRAGLTPTTNESQNSINEKSKKIKKEYGLALLMEANHHCPFIGCDKPLIITKNGYAEENYRVSMIDKEGKEDLQNLIVLCPDCYVTYQSDPRKKSTTSLKKVKKLLISIANSKLVISDKKFDEGIIQVLTNLSKLKYDEYDINLDPKDLTEKISPSSNLILYRTVKNSVLDNFLTIQKIMINLDKQGKIDYEEIQGQMRSLYKQLKKSKNDNLEIFNAIVDKLKKTTMQDVYYCQIIVSYFIQKCEVLE